MSDQVRLARVILAATGIASVVSILWLLAFSQTIEVGDGCGWDGSVYCAMFHGEAGKEPFGRRILVPKLAALIGDDPVAAFRTLNLFGAAAVVLLVMALTLLPGDRQGIGPAAPGHRPFYRTSALLVSLTAVLSARGLIHLTLSYPVLTDIWALLLLLVALYGIMRIDESRAFFAAACIAALLAPLAREITGVALMGGLLAAVYLGRARWPRAALAAIATALGTVAAFLQVPSSSAGGILDVIQYWIVQDFGSALGFARFATMLAIGLGFFWLPLLLGRFRQGLDTPDWILLATAAAFLASATFGGADTDRIVMPAGILLAIVVARAVSRDDRWALPAAFLTLAYFIAQAPFTVMGPSREGAIAFMALRLADPLDLIANGAAPVLVATTLAAIGIRLAPARAERGRDPGG